MFISNQFRSNIHENNNEPDSKKHKMGTVDDVNSIIEKKIKSQNRKFHALRNQLQENLTPTNLIEILESNNKQFEYTIIE